MKKKKVKRVRKKQKPISSNLYNPKKIIGKKKKIPFEKGKLQKEKAMR